MIKSGKLSVSVSVRRIGIILFSLALLGLLFHLLVTFTVKSHLKEFDEDCTFGGVVYGLNSILVRDLYMPGLGLFSTNTYVIFDGVPFHPKASFVIFEKARINYSSSGNSFSSSVQTEIDDLPVISIIDGSIPLYATSFYGTRVNGMNTGHASGDWGEVTVNQSQDSILVVFQNCSSIPGLDEAVPEMLQGHIISGNCRGVLGSVPTISGFITELDYESVSASFEYQLKENQPTASFNMDFSQITDPAMLLLDSISAGAVLAVSPSGSLSVSIMGSDSIFFGVDILFDSLTIWNPQLVEDTFSTVAAFSFDGFVLTEPGLLVIDSGTIQFIDALLDFNLRYSWGNRNKLELALSNPSISGEALTESIPPEFFGRLSGLSLGGDLSILAELVLDWDFPDSCDINLEIDASRLTVEYSPVTFGRIRNLSGAECLMRDSWGNSSLIGLDTLTNRDFVFFDSLPFCFEPLLRCAEDASFRRHHGFSEYHIRNSIRANLTEGRFVRGGSTISMQLAKNLFLGREKTLARKMQEVFLTWRLERWLTKNRILEIYANIVELGPGVFGFNSAAEYYFDERVSDLSTREMAFLVSILPGPKLYHRFAVRGELPAYWSSYLERLITICGDRGWLQNSLVLEAIADTLIFDGPVSLVES